MLREFFKLLPLVFLTLVYPGIFYYFTENFLGTILFSIGYFILYLSTALAFSDLNDFLPRKVVVRDKNIFFNDVKVVDMPVELPLVPPLAPGFNPEKPVVFVDRLVVEPQADPVGDFKGYCFNCKKVVPINDAITEDKITSRGSRTWIKSSSCRFCGHSVKGLLAKG